MTINQHNLTSQTDLMLEEMLPAQGLGSAIIVSAIGVLTSLANRKWVVISFAGVAFVLGIVWSLLQKPEYTAMTRIMTPQLTGSTADMFSSALQGSGLSALAAAAGAENFLANPNDIYLGLLNSRPVADAIIQKFDLAKTYRAKDMTAARKALANHSKIISERSSLISISVTDGDRKRAADLANSYTEQLRALTNSLAMTEAKRRRLFYEDQLKQAREDLVTAAASLQQIQQKKGLVQPDAQVKAVITNLADLQARVAAKQVELKALRSFSTDRNPSVQLAENELASLQAQLAQLQQGKRSSSSEGMGLQDVAGTGFDYLRAEHELEYRQTILDLLLKQYEAARLDESKDATIIQTVESAIPPDQKSAPRRAVIVLTFTFLGFLAACAYLFVGSLLEKHPELRQSLIEFKAAVVGK